MKKFLSGMMGALLMLSALPVYASAGNWADVSVDTRNTNNFTAGLTTDGTLYVWGEGEYGNNGSFAAAGRLSPTKVNFNKKVTDINGSYVLTTDGEVYYISFQKKTPSAVLMLSNVKKLCQNAAIKDNGDLYLLGYAVYDGNGNENNYNSLSDTSIFKVQSLKNVVSACNDGYKLAAVTSDGMLYTWGSNMDGQACSNGSLGYISNYPQYSEYSQIELYPKAVPNASGMKVVDAKFDGNCGNLYVLTANGTLYQNTINYSNKTTSLNDIMKNVKSIEAGSTFYWGNSVLAVSNDNKYFAKGYSSWSFGDGDVPSDWQEVNKQITKFPSVSNAVTNGYQFAVLTTSGDLYTWGQNSQGEIGNGQKSSSSGETGEVVKGDVLLAYSVPSPTVNNYISGDVNGDNLVNAKDAAGVLVEAAQVGAGLSTGFTKAQAAAADFNSDGAVNAKDAALILTRAAAIGAGVG